jgi:regulator of RNase E activity RraA
MNELTDELRTALTALDTPTVCNALEVVAPDRRGYGYTVQPLVCTRPELRPMVGVARTASIRAAHPSDLKGKSARALQDGYYAYVDEGPKPSIMVIQDLDGEQRGYGSFWGEVNSNIHKGLGCLGLITDGSVRDIPDIAEGFQMLADRVGPSHAFVHPVDFGRPVTVSGMRVASGDLMDRVGPSHAFVHPVDFGRPVTVSGMRVASGDLIHADQHGAVVIPWDVAAAVPEAAAAIARRERVIISAAQEPGFDMNRLRQAWGDAAEVH